MHAAGLHQQTLRSVCSLTRELIHHMGNPGRSHIKKLGYKSCTIPLGITAIPYDTPNFVVAKLILFHMVWLIFSFHNTHQRHAPICVPAITPLLVPLITRKSLLSLLSLIEYPERWHAKAMVQPILCLALDSSLFHELLYLFEDGCICYNAQHHTMVLIVLATMIWARLKRETHTSKDRIPLFNGNRLISILPGL